MYYVDYLCRPSISEDIVVPQNYHSIRDAKRAQALGLAVAIPEAVYEIPIGGGVTREEFKQFSEAAYKTAKWEIRKHTAVFDDDSRGEVLMPGFNVSGTYGDCTLDIDTGLSGVSADGKTRYRAKYAQGGFSSAQLSRARRSEFFRVVDPSLSALLERLDAYSAKVAEARCELRRQEEIARLAKEFSLDLSNAIITKPIIK